MFVPRLTTPELTITRRRDKRGLVKPLGGVDHELFAEVFIERLEVLDVIRVVAAELDQVGGVVARELCVDNLEVVGRAAIRLALDRDLGIRRLEQTDHLFGSVDAASLPH